MAESISTVRVGKTGVMVSRLGMGTAPIGNLYQPVPEAEAIETIQWSLEHGITFFDTAPLYGAGVSERRLGQALAGVPRDRFVVATKVGRLVRDGEVIFDYSRDGVLRSLEESLARLQMDRVEILHIHDPDNHYKQALDEAFPTLDDLRSQGVIDAIGAGMNQWQMEYDFARNADFNCFLLAGRYTLLEQTSLEFLEYCRSRTISIFLGGVYNSGILATGPKEGAKYNYREAPPKVMAKARRIQAVCDRLDVPLNVAAMQFARAHPAVSALVIGSASPSEAQNNRESWEMELPPELWAELRDEGLIEAEAPLPL